MPRERRFWPRPGGACLAALIGAVMFGGSSAARVRAAQAFDLPIGVLPSGDYDRAEVPVVPGDARPLGRARVGGEHGFRSMDLCDPQGRRYGPYQFRFRNIGPRSAAGMATSVYTTPQYDVWVVPHPQVPGLPLTYELHFASHGTTNYGEPGARHEHWTPRIAGGSNPCADTSHLPRPSVERQPTRDEPLVPAASRRERERHLHASFDCLWHAIALTRNAVPAVSLSRRFGERAESECRDQSAESFEGLDIAACWALLPPPRALLTEADRLFTEARKTPEPREGELIRAGEARIAEAKPLVERAVACYRELVRRHTESHRRR